MRHRLDTEDATELNNLSVAKDVLRVVVVVTKRKNQYI